MTIDAYIFHLIYERATSAVVTVMLVLSQMGSGAWLPAFVPLLVHRVARRFAAWLALTLTVNALIVFALKSVVRRARPFTALEGVRALARDVPVDYSFPSGHAAGCFCFAAFVTGVVLNRPIPKHLAYAISVLLVAVAVAVATSRILLGVHYPSDVAAGAVIGWAVGMLAAKTYVRAYPRMGKASRASGAD
jgi:undecaprenyl-diphosphatase